MKNSSLVGLKRGWRVLALGALLVCPACLEEPAPVANEVTIGALLPLSGDWASAGEAAAVAIEAAESEANRALAEIGAITRVTVRIEDTSTTRETAAARLQVLRTAGVTLVIGPFSEEATEGCTALADRIGVTLMSPASIADTLAGSDDALWRLLSPATRQAMSWGALLASDSIDVLVPVIRADRDGTALADALAEELTERGGIVLDVVAYDPGDMDGNDFRATLDLLEGVLTDAVADFDASRVGVLLAGFDESAALLSQAAERATAGMVRWYSAAALANHPRVIDDARAAMFAAKVGLTALGPARGDDERAAPVIETITAQLGRTPDPHALVAYDAVVLFSFSTEQALLTGGGTTTADFLPAVAGVYRGVAGTYAFDAFGDRTASVLDAWQVMDTGSGPVWNRIATLSGDVVTPIDIPDAMDESPAEGGT